MNNELIKKLEDSRQRLNDAIALPFPEHYKGEEEGGCGVVGFCATEPVAARHIHEPSRQMHNRGNGKGGGIAALGFVPEQLGVTRDILDKYYMLHVAFLDNSAVREMEEKYIKPYFEVANASQLDTIADWNSLPILEARPPDVRRYFLNPKANVLDSFIAQNSLSALTREEAEHEFFNQQSVRLNQEYYASLGEKKAFVMSCGKDIMILKVVGYAEAITDYYKINELKAHAFIAHQRFPTKGRVWHPGGAHPFGALNTALVHNGDFANYHSVCEYLAQRRIYPQFLTDTEVSVLLFDLLERTYHYPLEYIIEALAPTSELDFDKLTKEKQSLYRAIQATHVHASPDGPWFFIIARHLPAAQKFQLIGITDTAMLRPQVFAFVDGEVQVGLIASEKQAIDATLLSMSKDDSRICPIADRYWNARGGSHTDGGSFIFSLDKDKTGKFKLSCADKFGVPVKLPSGKEPGALIHKVTAPVKNDDAELRKRLEISGKAAFEYLSEKIPGMALEDCGVTCQSIISLAQEPALTAAAIEMLTLLNDRYYPTGDKKRKHIILEVREALHKLFGSLPVLNGTAPGAYRLITYHDRQNLRAPTAGETTMVIDARGFSPEGSDCDSALVMDAYFQGWKHFITFNCIGQRFAGCGLGPETKDVTIDMYDSAGDYLGSGIDGLTITVHGNAQDQLGQIIKTGNLVIHGDVGQTFLYGAKGGATYVLGNAAGRPLINSVGRPRVVINGTCLDFLAESFMAGDVFNGGGFVVLNGITFDDKGHLTPLEEPYAGSNLFSLASGGAIYIRDPHKSVVKQQLNGGAFFKTTDADWEVILPYLQENERLFGVKINDLLTVNGKLSKPSQVYRKVAPAAIKASTVPEEDDPEEYFQD
jgi:glutamate synthase domain-containing protein 1/glutamate synthase domain-containing protein 3